MRLYSLLESCSLRISLPPYVAKTAGFRMENTRTQMQRVQSESFGIRMTFLFLFNKSKQICTAGELCKCITFFTINVSF